MSEADYAALIAAAHRALRPAHRVWDNLNTHRSRKMRRFTAARAGLAHRFPPARLAPDLNAVEGAWASMAGGLGNPPPPPSTGSGPPSAPAPPDPAPARPHHRLPRPDRLTLESQPP